MELIGTAALVQQDLRPSISNSICSNSMAKRDRFLLASYSPAASDGTRRWIWMSVGPSSGSTTGRSSS